LSFKVHDIFRTVSNFLFSSVNREFLIFLFFLFLSGIFWLQMTLNETYEKEILVPLKIVNVPQNSVLTSSEVDTLRVTLRDKGMALLPYLFSGSVKPVSANFKAYVRGNDYGVIPNGELKSMISQDLAASTKIMSVKPERLEFFFNNGVSKRVPIRWSGRVIPEHLYFISGVEYAPDSVTVYAPKDKLDSIVVAYTETLNYANFRDTLSIDCGFRKIEGVKFQPERLKVTFFTDVLSEVGFDGVPIQGINLPEGKTLRLFPAKVRVNFVTGVNVYRQLKPTDFVVVADYNELLSNPSEKCNIYLRKVPYGISRATLAVKQVDYLIEEQGATTKEPDTKKP